MSAPAPASALVRDATRGDLAEVLDLQRSWQAEGSTHGYRADSPRGLAAWLRRVFVVAAIRGRLVGFATARVRRVAANAMHPRAHAVLEIVDVYVASRARGRGLGSRLVRHAIARGTELGVGIQCLSTASVDSDAALGFYRRLGFRAWSITMYRGGGSARVASRRRSA